MREAGVLGIDRLGLTHGFLEQGLSHIPPLIHRLEVASVMILVLDMRRTVMFPAPVAVSIVDESWGLAVFDRAGPMRHVACRLSKEREREREI